MCGGSNVKCRIKVIEIVDGYQVQITGRDVKEALKPENLKNCIEACCAGKAPFKEICCR